MYTILPVDGVCVLFIPPKFNFFILYNIQKRRECFAGTIQGCLSPTAAKSMYLVHHSPIPKVMVDEEEEAQNDQD